MEDDETLIEAVREFECLWKVRSKAYKDLRAKENAWKSVAEKVKSLLYELTYYYLIGYTWSSLLYPLSRLRTQL